MVKQKQLSKFNEDFIKKYDEDCNKGYLLEVDINYPKELFNFHKDLPFLPEKKGWKSWKSWKINLQYRRQRKICYSHKNFKTSVKLWVKTKKGTQSI